MEKLKPHFVLTTVKAAFADPDTLNRTYSSRQGADALGIDDRQIVAIIQGIEPGDFEKSMTSLHDHRIWQDVYKPVLSGTALYVKFTLDAKGNLLLISFKQA